MTSRAPKAPTEQTAKAEPPAPKVPPGPPPRPLEDDIKIIVGEYEKINTSRPGCFIVRNKDGSKKFEMLAGGCHAGLSGLDSYATSYPGKYGKLPSSKQADHMLTAFPIYHPVHYLWYTFLVNHLFAEYKDNFELIDTGIPILNGFQLYNANHWPKYEIKEGEARLNHMIIKIDLNNIPGNVVFNFCICSRAVIEKNVYLSGWKNMMDHGLPPSVAMMYALQVPHGITKGGLNQLLNWSSEYWQLTGGHWPFDNTSDVERIMTGKLDSNKFTKPYNEDTSRSACLPTNVIWGEAGRKYHDIFKSNNLGKALKALGVELKPVDFTDPLWVVQYRAIAQEPKPDPYGEDDNKDFD